MKIAIITDVHANLPALEAALAAIAREGSGALIMLYRPQSGRDLVAALTDDPSAPLPATK